MHMSLCKSICGEKISHRLLFNEMFLLQDPPTKKSHKEEYSISSPACDNLT